MRLVALGAPSQVQRDVSRRVELDDGVGALVDDPHVVVLVEPDRVRVAEAIHALADLADEVPVVIELEQLRRCVAVERTRRGGAGVIQHDEVAHGVLGHGKCLTEIHLGRVLEVVRHRHERNHRSVAVVRLLREDRCDDEGKGYERGGRPTGRGDPTGNDEASHDEPPLSRTKQDRTA